MATNFNVNDDCKAMVPYIGNIEECQLNIIYTVECIKAQELLEKKIIKLIKENKKNINSLQARISSCERQNELDERKKESLIAAIGNLRIEELQKQLFTAKEKTRVRIANGNIKLKQYAEQWETNKNNFLSIEFVKKYFEVTNKVKTVKENIENYIDDSKKLATDIELKKDELFNLDKIRIIELADFMIIKRPVISKLINEKLNEKRQLEKNKEVALKNNLLSSNFTKVTNDPKNIHVDDMETHFDKYKTHETSVLPKLQLYDSVNLSLNGFEQLQEDNFKGTAPSAAPVKRSTIYPTLFDYREDYVSTYFNSPTKTGVTKKYSHKKLINILEDVKLDTKATYEIISNVKPHQLQAVTVIEAGPPQSDLVDNQTHATINEQETDEVIEKIDLTKKTSQDVVLLPPTQFLDLSQISQEKRVTFSSVVTVNDAPNVVIEDTKSQNDDNMTATLNTSIASDDSYMKIKEHVFQKRNFNLSPQFTYNKNTVTSKVTDKTVTSKFFDEKQNAADGEKMEVDKPVEQMEDVRIDDDGDEEKNKSKNDTMETNDENIKPANASDILLQAPECTQNDVEPSGLFRSYMQRPDGSLNMTLNTTGCEDEDGDFSQCAYDPSLLLSPKADDGMKIDINESEVQSQEMPSFLSGLRKTGLSFFGNTSSVNKPENVQENPSNNFNFNFSEDKVKRGGLFSMFR